MMNNALRRNPAKNDKRKTAKAVTPLRSMENLFLLCRNLTSTCGVESPLVLARIFLTGYPSLYIVYENRNCYLQAIKIPPNLKQVWRVLVKSFGHSNTAHQIAVFLFGGRIYLWFCKKKSRQTVISHMFIGSASNVSGSLMTVTCKFVTFINISCLHFGQ